MLLLFLLFMFFVVVFQLRSRGREQVRADATVALSANLAEPGEVVELTVTLTNRSRHFIPYLRVNVRLPQGMTTPLEEKRLHLKLLGLEELATTTWLAPMQQLKLRFPVRAERRGRYLIDRLILSDGDFVGLREYNETVPFFVELVVAPKAAPGRALKDIPGSFPGNLSVDRFLFEDPVLTIGCVDYTGQEPMKSIAWIASARTGRLMVKKYDHTMESSVAVVVNVHTYAQDRDRRVEACYSLARTACRQLEDKGIQYSFFCNALVEGRDALLSVSAGLGQKHFLRILELLGRVQVYGQLPVEHLLTRAMDRNHNICGLLLITPAPDRAILATARRMTAGKGINIATLIPEEVES